MQDQNSKTEHNEQKKSKNMETLIIIVIIVVAAYFLFLHDNKKEGSIGIMRGGFSENIPKLSEILTATSNISPLSSSIGTINYSSKY